VLADNCEGVFPGLGGHLNAGECQITEAVLRTGTYNLDETLHVFGAGSIDASGDLGVGITLNICTPPAAAGACDLILDSPSVVGGGQIRANDTGAANPDDASPITINVSRDVLMLAGSAIRAEDTITGGSGGAITITTGGNMTMCGQTGLHAGCVAPAGNPGALISSQKLAGAGDTGDGGYITITVGSQLTATGTFYMEGGVKTYGAETGAKILSDSPGRAGDISVTAGKTYFTEPGSVVEAGGPFAVGSAIQHGAKIFLVSDCALTSQGRVTSKGPDPAADLVHLESCTVLIEGLVESTGKGHTTGAPNSCDAVNDGLPGEVVRPGKPANATGCIEVWGNFITIDSTPPWAGELNSDIGNGGAGGTSWIDIFAFSDLTVIDGTGNDFVRDNLGHTYFSTYAVHANAIDGSDNTPSVVTALVQSGPLTAKSDGEAGGGRVFEASSTMTTDTGHNGLPQFVGNGSDGGTIDLEASGNVTLLNAWVNASGDFAPGTPGGGGHILVSAWGALSTLSWTNGDGDVQPDATGDIKLNACAGVLSITTTGTDFHGEVPALSANCVPTTLIPVSIDGDIVFDQASWSLCGGGSSVSGVKFNDLNKNHVQDGSEPGIPNWEIKIYAAADLINALFTTTTSGTAGAYSFPGLAPGNYVVCETPQITWTQSAPQAGPTCTNGTVGYAVTITGANCAGEQVTGKDFGNFQAPQPPPPCEKQPVQAVLNPTSGQYPGNLGPDYLVRVNHGDLVQAAVDAAALADSATTGDINGDGYIIITVSAHDDGTLGGSAAQNVVISKTYNHPFALVGCSVTLTGGIAITSSASDPGLTIPESASGKSIIFLMDLHGGGSAIGVKVDGDHRYLRNEGGSGNGVGFSINGNFNTMHNGAAIGNSGDGVSITGNSNYLTDTNSMSNGGNGFNVTGSFNKLLKLDAGEKATPNILDGVHVVGSNNTLSEIDAYANSGDGIDVAGSGNTLTKNVAGDKNKGNGGNGILVVGASNSLTENKANANKGDGFNLSGALTSATANLLKNNVSNTGNSGDVSLENVGAEYRLLNYIKNNGGGNKADNITIPKTSPTKCPLFPASNATSNLTGATGVCE
jgi:hypothetical protein